MAAISSILQNSVFILSSVNEVSTLAAASCIAFCLAFSKMCCGVPQKPKGERKKRKATQMDRRPPLPPKPEKPARSYILLFAPNAVCETLDTKLNTYREETDLFGVVFLRFVYLFDDMSAEPLRLLVQRHHQQNFQTIFTTCLLILFNNQKFNERVVHILPDHDDKVTMMTRCKVTMMARCKVSMMAR